MTKSWTESTPSEPPAAVCSSSGRGFAPPSRRTNRPHKDRHLLKLLQLAIAIRRNQKFKLIRTFYDYSARLATDPEKSIDLLASATGVTVAVAINNINNMLAAGFFPNCYLDGQRNKLVAPDASQTQASTVSTPTHTATTQTVKYTTVQCKGCGATNKIISGTVGECEFCGSKISE